MARPIRYEAPGAIYHVVTRGDGRRQIFHDGGHYDRFTRGLKEEVTRSGWKLQPCCVDVGQARRLRACQRDSV